MKRIFRFVILAVAMASVACTEDATTDYFAENGVVEEEEYLGETVRLALDVTRASLDGLEMTFEAGDVVYVNGSNVLVRVDSQGAYLRAPKAEDNIYRAIFPAPAATTFAASDHYAYIHSNMQVYQPDSFGREAMCLTSYVDLNDGEGFPVLSFNAMLGVLKLTVKGEGEVRSIRLQNNAFDQTNSLTAMSGRTKFVDSKGVTLGANELYGAHHAAPYGYSGMTEDIVLICNDIDGRGVQLSQNGTDFYFTIYPQEYAEGFTVTISDNNGKSQRFSTSGSTTVPVNTLVAMQPITYAPSSDLIFSEPFDVCVYGGDVVAFRNDGSVWRARTPIHASGSVVNGLPLLSTHTEQDGLQPGYYLTTNATQLSGDGVTQHKIVTPGLIFSDYTDEGTGYTATMDDVIAAGKLRVTPELLNVRGLNDWFMSRCVEYHGYLSVGNEKALNSYSAFKFSVNPLGILTTPKLSAVSGTEHVELYFDIAAGDGVTGYCKKDTPSSSNSFYTYQPDATAADSENNISWREDKFRLFVTGDESATILKLEFIDQDGTVMSRADGSLMRYAPSDNYVEVPESDIPATWAKVRVQVANATADTRFRFYNNQSTRYMVYHVDNIEVRRASFADIPSNTNVMGTVTCEGKPMAGVVVSDGENVTQTDSTGTYYLATDTETASHIFVTIPSGYEMVGKNKISPAFFSAVKSNTALQSHDFQLRKVDQSNYTIMVIADSHVLGGGANYGSTNDRTYFNNKFMPKWNAYAASCPGPVYGIHLGDMTQRGYWTKYKLSNYATDCSASTVPIFSIMGNHDHDIPTLNLYDFGEDEQYKARKSFTSAVGPAYYSFELGTEHYIMLDNSLIIDDDSGSDNFSDSKATGFKVKLDPKQLAWLQYDVARIDKTKIKGVVICAHCQFYYASGSYAMINASEVMQAVKSFPVTLLIGHSHIDRYTEASTPTYAKTVREYLNPALMGVAWLGDLVTTDGIPASFVTYTFNNGKTASRKFVPFALTEEISHRTYDKNSSYTITEGSFSAKKAEDDDASKTAPAVIVNAWGAKLVTFRESSGGTGTTLRTKSYDPYFRTWFYESLNSSDRNSILCNKTYPDGPTWQQPYLSPHIWKYIPADPTATITATVTDEFGGSKTLTMQAQ